jgi:hypothetical protein
MFSDDFCHKNDRFLDYLNPLYQAHGMRMEDHKDWEDKGRGLLLLLERCETVSLRSCAPPSPTRYMSEH